MSTKIRLSRQQLATFLSDPDSIRAFERVFDICSEADGGFIVTYGTNWPAALANALGLNWLVALAQNLGNAILSRITAATMDADTVSGAGIGADAPNYYNAAMNVIPGGSILHTQGTTTVNHPDTTGPVFTIGRTGFKTQLAFGVNNGHIYFRQETSSNVYGSWQPVWNGSNDGNGGQPPAPKNTASRTGDGNIITNFSVPSGAYGLIAIARGYNGANGVAWSASYNIAVRPIGGAGADVSASLIVRNGDPTSTVSWSNVGGFLTATIASSSAGVSHIVLLGAY